MTIQEALKSQKWFKRKIWTKYHTLTPLGMTIVPINKKGNPSCALWSIELSIDDILAEDWETFNTVR